FSKLFFIPDCPPVGIDPSTGEYRTVSQVEIDGSIIDCYAVAAFLEPGLVRSHLPAVDGAHVMPLRMFAQDYKPAFDPDDAKSIEQFGGNLNTGGTGCYCPHKEVSPWLVNRIIKEIVNPTVNAIYNDLGWAYKGIIYFGLNLDPYDQLDVFEINVRHGDPEWPVIARKLSTDLFEIGMAVWDSTLDRIKQVWNKQHYVDVIAMI
ncbi:unnamed protein product, partial [marine sediment metagenome]